MIALLDNTVLSNFTTIERSGLVRVALGEDAATSEAAWAELQAGIRIGSLPRRSLLPGHSCQARISGLHRRPGCPRTGCQVAHSHFRNPGPVDAAHRVESPLPGRRGCPASPNDHCWLSLSRDLLARVALTSCQAVTSTPSLCRLYGHGSPRCAATGMMSPMSTTLLWLKS